MNKKIVGDSNVAEQIAWVYASVFAKLVNVSHLMSMTEMKRECRCLLYVWEIIYASRWLDIVCETNIDKRPTFPMFVVSTNFTTCVQCDIDQGFSAAPINFDIFSSWRLFSFSIIQAMNSMFSISVYLYSCIAKNEGGSSSNNGNNNQSKCLNDKTEQSYTRMNIYTQRRFDYNFSSKCFGEHSWGSLETATWE